MRFMVFYGETLILYTLCPVIHNNEIRKLKLFISGKKRSKPQTNLMNLSLYGYLIKMSICPRIMMRYEHLFCEFRVQ